MPSLAQRCACAAVRSDNTAVRGTNPAQGPLMTTKFLEKTFRLGLGPLGPLGFNSPNIAQRHALSFKEIRQCSRFTNAFCTSRL